MRFSYSQFSLWQKCSRAWKHRYVNKLDSGVIGASLIFGSACDASVSALLQGKTEWKDIFIQKMNQCGMNNKLIDVFTDETIVYSYSDYDFYVLKDVDLVLMKSWVTELNLSSLSTEPNEVYKECVKIKKNKYKTTTKEVLIYFNRCSWLSLLRKGEILLQAFYEQIYPKITKVIAVQKQVNLKDEVTGDSLTGIVDLIVNLEGYGEQTIVLDLKTSAMAYDQEQIETSQQLVLYAGLMAKEYGLPLHVGYVTLIKNIEKETVAHCSQCGHTKDSKHKTCNNLIGTNRCEGAWLETKKLVPKIQLMIEKKDEFQVNELFKDFGSVMVAAKNDLTFRNTDSCLNFYGQKCQYFSLCFKGDSTGLVKK